MTVFIVNNHVASGSATGRLLDYNFPGKVLFPWFRHEDLTLQAVNATVANSASQLMTAWKPRR